jgi:hypothetical protein
LSKDVWSLCGSFCWKLFFFDPFCRRLCSFTGTKHSPGKSTRTPTNQSQRVLVSHAFIQVIFIFEWRILCYEIQNFSGQRSHRSCCW